MSTGQKIPIVSQVESKRCQGAGDCRNTCHSPCVGDEQETNDTLLDAPEHVLSTLDADGSRRWLNPRIVTGALWRRRKIVAYLLMCVFVLIPHLRIGGKPLILLDIAAREFTLLGRTFLPTDTLLLALFMLTAFIGVVLVTAITGRAWCGWGCPQTVYLEFLFRPIDRLFEGTRGRGGKPRRIPKPALQALRLAVYVALCMLLAHTFLAYFVGTDRLAVWIRSSPVQHPTAFLVMAGTTALMLFDFLFFREQLCMIACPYGRLQSVMLDRQSMIVAYDLNRGEPRKKGKHFADDAVGDCVDCGRCVSVCPTGIDIRDGLQMECINCTQCIDACNDVMDRVGSARGLIRFSSQDAIAGKPHRIIRGRTIAYPLILIALVSGLVFTLATKSGFDVRIMRGKGAPFVVDDEGTVSNAFSIRLVNRTDEQQEYSFSIVGTEEIDVDVIDSERLVLSGGETTLVPVIVSFSSNVTAGTGNRSEMLRVNEKSGREKDAKFTILGPAK